MQEEVKQSDDVVKDIFVLINHQPVKLSGKKKYGSLTYLIFMILTSASRRALMLF